MARPRAFDEIQTLDRAMLVFWQRGFASTSISDLEHATDMKRQSLYNAFGDKQQLYRRALQRYSERMGELLAPLRRPGAGLRQLRKSMLDMVCLQEENDCGACMVVKAAFDRQIDDPEITKAVRAAGVHTRKLYAQVLRQAQAAGEVAADADPEALSSYVFSISAGLSALAQTGASNAEVKSALEFALGAILQAPSDSSG